MNWQKLYEELAKEIRQASKINTCLLAKFAADGDIESPEYHRAIGKRHLLTHLKSIIDPEFE